MKNQVIEYSFWCGSEDVLSEYNSLLNMVFSGRRAEPSYMLWKHLANPQGRSLITIARCEGKMVGARAFQYTFVEGFRFLQPCDTVTHPEFRRRGVFGELTSMVVNKVSDDIPVLNFPNNSSLPAYLKQGWEVNIRLKPKVNFVLHSGFGSSLKLLTKDAAEELLAELGCAQWREYCRWRFFGSPKAKYKYYIKGRVLVVVNERKMAYSIRLTSNGASQRIKRNLPFMTYTYELSRDYDLMDSLIHKFTGRGTNLVVRKLADYRALTAISDLELSGLMDTF